MSVYSITKRKLYNIFYFIFLKICHARNKNQSLAIKKQTIWVLKMAQPNFITHFFHDFEF